MGVGKREGGEELGKQLHIVRLALDSMGEHEVGSWNGFARPWGDDRRS